ncbi:MAG: hypothetical protein MJ077_12205 [Oscillospiraceae bacterium]|nr:hypothetical protein [Oscillospiraceae bacterium]
MWYDASRFCFFPPKRWEKILIKNPLAFAQNGQKSSASPFKNFFPFSPKKFEKPVAMSVV